MSGWDSRLEKGPDGQKCRTCIYRAANRYGPVGLRLRGRDGAVEARSVPGRGAGDAGGAALHRLSAREGREEAGADPAAEDEEAARRTEAEATGELDTLAEQSADRRRAAGALRPRVDRRADRGTAGHEPRDDQKMAAAQRVSGKRMADEESRKGHVILGKDGPAGRPGHLWSITGRRETPYIIRVRAYFGRVLKDLSIRTGGRKRRWEGNG